MSFLDNHNLCNAAASICLSIRCGSLLSCRAFGLESSGLFDDPERATQRMIRHESEGTVNLRVHPTVAHHWSIPKLNEFIEKHPNIRVRFDACVEPLDFRGTHLDASLQLGNGDWRDTRMRKLWDKEVDVVCSTRYLNSIGDLEGLKDVGKGGNPAFPLSPTCVGILGEGRAYGS